MQYQVGQAGSNGNGGIAIDPAYFPGNLYISTSGKAVCDSFRSGFTHELSHAVTGLKDNDSFANMAGANVVNANKWFAEAGFAPQATYQSYDHGLGILASGFDYTGGNTVTKIIMDNGGGNGGIYDNSYPPTSGATFDTEKIDLKLSGLIDRSLIIGGSADNTYGGTDAGDWIYGGGGADHLDGRDGDDFLSGGAGDDTIVGGDGNDEIWGGDKNNDIGAADGSDTVDYSDNTKAITITFDGSGASPVLTVDDGTGGTDTLHSIEKVLGTTKRDYLRYKGDIAAGHPLTIDAGAGQTGPGSDILNLDGSTSGLTLNITAGTLTSKNTGRVINLVNFHTQVIGSQFDDDIEDATSGKKYIDGGDGDDTISVAGATSDAVLLGGWGNNTLTGGDGNDILYGIDGLNELNGGAGDDYLITSETFNNALNGGMGNDYILLENTWYASITGGAGNDVIDAVTHTDNLTGRARSGTVYFGVGDGHDSILKGDVPEGFPATWGIDTIDMSTLASTDVSFVWDATFLSGFNISGDGDLWISNFTGKLAITINSTGESIYLGEVSGSTIYHAPDLQTDPSVGGPYLEIPNIIFSDANGYGAISVGDASQYNVALNDYAGHGVGPDVSLTGTSGDDTMDSDGRNGSINTAGGDDTVRLTGGNIAVDGGSGNDTVEIFGSLGSFQRSFDGSSLTVSGYGIISGTASLTNVETIYSITDNVSYSVADLVAMFGSSGDDDIHGTNFDDVLNGGDGDDTIRPGSGSDVIDGGDGFDQVIYEGSSNDYQISLVPDGTINVYNPSTPYKYDVLSGIESLTFLGDNQIILPTSLPPLGTEFSDTITATARGGSLYGLGDDDSLYGAAGMDSLIGGDGDDLAQGAGGNDYIDGGEGNDIALYSGVSSDYLFSSNGWGDLTIQDTSANRDGADLLYNVETIRFSDGDFAAGDLIPAARQAAQISYRNPTVFSDVGNTRASGDVAVRPNFARDAAVLAEKMASFGTLEASDFVLGHKPTGQDSALWSVSSREPFGLRQLQPAMA